MQQLTNRAGKAVCNAGKTTENYSLYRVGIFKTMHDIKNVCYSGQIVLQFCAEMNCIFPYLLFAQKKKKRMYLWKKFKLNIQRCWHSNEVIILYVGDYLSAGP